MKPAPFSYARPGSLAEALDILAAQPGAKVIAGAQSLGPMLNLRLLQPSLVVDISGLAELRTAREEDGDLVLGACVTHADIEDGRVPDLTGGAMARVAAAIAYRPVRNRGTIGGSLAHADPAADWVTALTCLGASVEIASRSGRRRLPVASFICGALAVALEPGEIVTAVRIPATAPSARFGYVKQCRKAGEFAHAIGAVLVDVEAGTARLVTGAVDGPPIVLADPLALFGGRIGRDVAARFDRPAAHAALRAAGLADDVDRHVQVTMLARALAQAAADLDGPALRQAA